MHATQYLHKSKWIILIGVLGAAGLLMTSLWLSILTPSNASAATPIYVRPDGSDTLCNGTVDTDASHSPDCAFRTISKGISDVNLDGTVNVAAGLYNELVELNRVVTVTMSGNITVTGNLSLTEGALNAPSGILTLQGDYERDINGQFRRNSGTLKLNGAAAQTLKGNWVTGFWNLTIDNPHGVFLGFNQSVDANLSLVNGNLYLGAYTLIMGPSGAVVGSFSASKMIVTNGSGELCKGYTNSIAPPISSFLFPIGDASGTSEYSPMTVSYSAGVFGIAPKVCGRVVNVRHPDNYFPIHIRRYWMLDSENISSYSADLTFQYVDADVEGYETNLLTLRKTTTGWNVGSAANTATNILTMTGVSTLTAFTGGGNESTIEIDSYQASRTNIGIRLDWDTTYENNITGFYLYRDVGTTQPTNPINTTIIPSYFSLSLPPGAYVYTDTQAAPGIYQNYWLEYVTNLARARHSVRSLRSGIHTPSRQTRLRMATCSNGARTIKPM